jgi:hypothetical protein
MSLEKNTKRHILSNKSFLSHGKWSIIDMIIKIQSGICMNAITTDDSHPLDPSGCL